MARYGERGGFGFWIFMILLVILFLLYFYRTAFIEFLKNNKFW